MTTPEDKARENIDRLLTQAGWAVRDQSDPSILAYRGVAIRKFSLSKSQLLCSPKPTPAENTFFRSFTSPDGTTIKSASKRVSLMAGSSWQETSPAVGLQNAPTTYYDMPGILCWRWLKPSRHTSCRAMDYNKLRTTPRFSD